MTESAITRAFQGLGATYTFRNLDPLKLLQHSLCKIIQIIVLLSCDESFSNCLALSFLPAWTISLSTHALRMHMVSKVYVLFLSTTKAYAAILAIRRHVFFHLLFHIVLNYVPSPSRTTQVIRTEVLASRSIVSFNVTEYVSLSIQTLTGSIGTSFIFLGAKCRYEYIYIINQIIYHILY